MSTGLPAERCPPRHLPSGPHTVPDSLRAWGGLRVHAFTCVHSCAWARVHWELCCEVAPLPLPFHRCPVLLDKDTHAPPGSGPPASGQSQVRIASLPSGSLRSRGDTVSLSTQMPSPHRGLHSCGLLRASPLSWEGCRPRCLPPFSDGETESQQFDAIID